MKKLIQKFNGLSKRKRDNLVYGSLLMFGVLLIIVALIIYGQRTGNFKTYVNKAAGIKIKYPATWDVKEGLPGSVVAFVAPKENALDVFQENAVVVVQNMPTTPMTLENYTKVAMLQMEGVFGKEIRVLESRATMFAGQPAHRFVYQTTDPANPVPFRALHIWCVKGPMAYQFNFGGAISNFDNYRSTMNRMIRSFTIL